MMRRRSWSVLLLLWLAGSAVAATPSGDEAQARDHFAAGTHAYQSGDFAAALAAYRAALEAGLSEPAVHYNIGVCAWELGRLDEAEAAFLAASEHPPMAGLAYYNLGLVSQRRGDRDAARDWFERARAVSTDETLQALVAAQLAARPAGAAGATAAKAARPGPIAFAAVQAGYDDNVALVADDELLGASGLESAFLDAQFAASFPLGAALRLEAGGFLLRYADLDEFDQAGGQLALLAERKFGDWTGELGAGYTLNQLDGERFENRRSLSFGATRRLDAAWDLRLRYRYEDIDAREPFAALTGDRQEVSVRARRRGEASRLRLEYRFETNDREGDAVSPDRHQLEAEWTVGAPVGIQRVLGLGARYGSYSLAGDSESERRLFASAGLTGPLAGRWQWTVRYDWTRNDATENIFDYTRQRVFAGVEAVFD
ncbi:MAG: tetratricopeptide repeat protein [Gammaproteobacteria bacterium]